MKNCIIVTASQEPLEPIKTIFINGIPYDSEYMGDGTYLVKDEPMCLMEQQKQAKEQ